LTEAETLEMTALAVVSVVLAVGSPAATPVSVDSGGRVSFAQEVGDMSLLGVGVRTRTFLKLKVYALGLYVADSALTGTLAVHRGKVGTPAFYRDLVEGDFEKQIVLKPLRDLSAEQIQRGFRSHMTKADKGLLEQFVSYFPESVRAGQECVLHWVPGGGLHTTVAGVVKPTIADKAFADALFAIWLRDRPAGDPIPTQVVSRADELLMRLGGSPNAAEPGRGPAQTKLVAEPVVLQ
jgi:hypothetical protein